jgi:hypothetical protein
VPNQHKHPPIAFRPPEGDRAWLLEHAAATGEPVNRILARALAEYRARRENREESPIRKQENLRWQKQRPQPAEAQPAESSSLSSLS